MPDPTATTTGETGRELLARADAEAEAGRDGTSLLRRARFLLQREGDLAGFAAVLRREARLLDGDARILALREATRIARGAGDPIGEIESLEDLSREHAEAGRPGPAVALLGEIVRIHAERGDASGQVRALLLAGRVLCEAWGEGRDPGPGLVMLLWAADAANSVDDSLAKMTRDYIEGYQYTLSDAEFSSIEPLFALDRAAVMDATFGRYRLLHAECLP